MSFEQALLDSIGTSTTNRTSRWVGSQPGLFESLVEYLNRKLPRSAALGKNEDHVLKFLEDLIRRDSIGKRLARQEKTYMSQVKAWCLKNAHTQNRDAGVDALSRCMHGALTRREWSKNPPPSKSSNWTTQVVPKTLHRSEYSTGPGHDPELEVQTDGVEFLISPHNPELIVGGQLDLETLFDEFRHVFEGVMPQPDSEFHVGVIQDFFVERRQVAEISELRGVPKSEVTNAIMRVRRILRKSRDAGAFSEFGVQA